jgi:hypothetical protein
MSDVVKPCPLCRSAPWPGTSSWGTPTAACSGQNCALVGVEVPADEWNARPIEGALRAELSAALADTAALRSEVDQWRALGVSLLTAQASKGEVKPKRDLPPLTRTCAVIPPCFSCCRNMPCEYGGDQ